MKFNSLIPLLLFLVFLSNNAISQSRNDEQLWLQFRGENARGIAHENARPPVDFGQDNNVLWKIKTPEGYSSPIIIDNNLIITGVVKEEKKYLIWNINTLDGSTRWKREIIVDTLEQVHPVSSPAAATPASDGEYIYCFFPTLGLISFDLEGNKIWETPVKYYYVANGSGTSPVVFEDKILLNYDNYTKPMVLCFNKQDGKQIWEYFSPKFPMISSMSWSTPVVWNNQVIIHRMSEIRGINLDNGHSVWNFDIGSTGCATPVVEDNTLYVNSWMIRGEESILGEVLDFKELFIEVDTDNNSEFTKEEFLDKYPEGVLIHDRVVEGKDMGSKYIVSWWHLRGFDSNKDDLLTPNEWGEFTKLMDDYSKHGTVAIKLGEKGNISITGRLWKTSKNVPETPSVLVKGGLLYMVKNGGLLTCLDTQNGEIIYSTRLGAAGAYLASPLYANGVIFICSYNGKITIIKEGLEFELINQVDLDEKIGSSPVAVKDKLYIRTADHLYAFTRKSSRE